MSFADLIRILVARKGIPALRTGFARMPTTILMAHLHISRGKKMLDHIITLDSMLLRLVPVRTSPDVRLLA
jgi:hypothetical protein